MAKNTTHPLIPSSPRPSRWVAAWAALWDDLVGCARWAIARRPEHLDDAALRDLGMHRSEMQSFRAEAAGLAEATRRRVLAQRCRML